MASCSDAEKTVPGTVSADEVHARLATATPSEQRGILQELYQTAYETRHPADRLSFAKACLQVGDFGNAIDVLRYLVEEGDSARIKLANAHYKAENFDLCRLYLRQVAEHGVTSEVREEGEEHLRRATEAWYCAEEGLELRMLQVAALKERLAEGSVGTEDVQRLAHLLLEIEKLQPDKASLMEAIEVLEKGRADFDDDVCVLEMLAECLIRFDPEEKLEGVLEVLRRMAPESEVFDLLQAQQQILEQQSEDLDARLDLLKALVETGNAEVQAAAVADMHRVVAAMPSNIGYRTLYALALTIIDEQEAALAQTKVLARYDLDDHQHHFNIAHLYRKLDEDVRAREHAEAALRYATSEEDIADAKQLLEQLDDED